ncbi:ABC transporter permease [Halopseudomonas salegens]|uniref:Transport permease protein n=1 Tax=Halopseudomonas salegens TaxID=1434072 RepID=A0A1H2HVS5_9GAMM|nr:ABC transporter permease [Halopseudomonas salegens]SDU35992.1 lipopolysaccharide transport system permease protein [Halopseudomonas salegens]
MLNYLNLLRQITLRDILSRYKGAAMGLVWSFVTPLAMLVVYTFVFSEVFGARWHVGSDDRVGFAINLFAGLIVHGAFAECASRATGLIAQNQNYVKRVVFPLWLLSPMVMLSALFHAMISFLVLLLAFAWFYGFVHWQVIFLPIVLLPYVIFLLGVIWLLSALGVFLRDIGQVMPVLITAMLFMAPVFYPVNALPEAFQGWLYFNPLTPAIEMIRALLVVGELPSLALYCKYSLASALAAACGLAFFLRVRKGFADVL